MRKLSNTAAYPIISYAQNREDIIIASLLRDVSDDEGFYVDVGAAHPDYLSVTKYFYTRGWRGVNVEPNTRLFQLLKRARPRDQTFQLAISDGRGTKKSFREYLGDGLSTMSDRVIAEYDASEQAIGTQHFVDYTVEVKTLAGILDEAKPKQIHFMKVDVEGYEDHVLKSNNWTKYRPWIICIEANHGKSNWQDFLLKQKYELVYHDGLNDYYADSKHFQQLPQVEYGSILDYRVLNPYWNTQLSLLQDTIDSQVNKLEILSRELASRPTTDGEGIRFRQLGVVFAKKVDAVITGKLNPAISSGAKVMVEHADTSDSDHWNSITESAGRGSSATPGLKKRLRQQGFRGYRIVKKIVKSAKKKGN